MKLKSCKRCVVHAVLSLCFLPAVAFAADSGQSPNIKEIPQPDYLPATPGDSLESPRIKPSADTFQPEENSAKIKLDRVVFEGNTVFPTASFDTITANYVGRVVSISELEGLRQQLTKYYIEHGYVNSGVLIASLSDGVVVFKVIEGRLSQIRLRGMQGLNEKYVSRKLAKTSDGPLNMNDLRERYQLLLGDPLIQRMNARLMPDAQLGQAILDVDVVRTRPYKITATFNNYRPPSVGSEALILSGAVYNLSGQGDILEASIQRPTQWSSGSRNSLAWRTPVGYSGTQFSLALDRGNSSVLEEPLRILDIQSVLSSQDIGVSQTFIESLANKLTVGVNYVKRENSTTLLGLPFSFTAGELNGLTQETLIRFWQEYVHRSETQVLAVRATLTSGNNNIQDVAYLPAESKIAPQYKTWLVQTQYARQVMENGAQFVAKGTIQMSQDRLLSLDGISVGGVGSVRGYRENQLVRDNGQFVNFEFEYPYNRFLDKGVKLSGIPFVDFGRAQNQGESASTISSLGLAGRLYWKGVNADVAIAKKLSSTESANSNGSNLQDNGVHFQVSYNY